MEIKRILMIGPVDFSKEYGPKVHFSNLLKEFVRLGFTVSCLVYAPEGEIVDSIDKNFSVNFSPNPLIGNLFLRVFKYLLLIPVILWHFFKFTPHIVYFRFSPPAFLYLLFLNLFKIFPYKFKILLEFNAWAPEERRIQGERKLKVKLIKFLQVKSAFFSDSIRVVAPGIKEKLVISGVKNKKITVIENGTDINHFKPIKKNEAKEKIGLNPAYLYVGFIGNFAVWQGLDYLVRAIPKVLKAYANVRFLLVGDGPEMPKIKKAISKFEKGKVILTGSVPYRKANLYINAFDIGVAPFIKKRNDGMVSPMKIRDYAACGIPFVTTKIRGLEMVEEKDIGILVPPDNPDALSDAILKLVENRGLRNAMGEKGRRVAEQEFSWEKVAGQILDRIGNLTIQK